MSQLSFGCDEIVRCRVALESELDGSVFYFRDPSHHHRARRRFVRCWTRTRCCVMARWSVVAGPRALRRCLREERSSSTSCWTARRWLGCLSSRWGTTRTRCRRSRRSSAVLSAVTPGPCSCATCPGTRRSVVRRMRGVIAFWEKLHCNLPFAIAGATFVVLSSAQGCVVMLTAGGVEGAIGRTGTSETRRQRRRHAQRETPILPRHRRLHPARTSVSWVASFADSSVASQEGS